LSDTATDPLAPALAVRRLGVVLEADSRDPRQSLGVLNPASAVGPDGTSYLFPRVVADGNLSRIARGALRFEDGLPVGVVDPLEIVLEPTEPWERNAVSGGGVEDARIVALEGMGWVMTYTAHGPLGPRIGLALSRDLERWRRLGPVSFAYEPGLGTDLNLYTNKDAVLVPEPVTAPDGREAYAVIHRPTWDLSIARPGERHEPPHEASDPRPSVWVSFADVAEARRDPLALGRLFGHRELMVPREDWEAARIGAGPPPMRTEHGWLLLYHGVSGSSTQSWPITDVRYCVGAALLDLETASRVRWRSRKPLLVPATRAERHGLVDDVVFPTALEPRGDGVAHVYYGMADSRIGAFELTAA